MSSKILIPFHPARGQNRHPRPCRLIKRFNLKRRNSHLFTIIFCVAISFTHAGFPIVFASSDEYYGNQLRATSATYSPYLDSNGEKLSIRFTAQDSKDVNEVAIYITPFDTLKKRYQYTIGLQSDNDGEPSGTWMNDNNASWSGGDLEWRWFTLSSSVSLTGGTVYHLVVEAIAANSSDSICFRGTHPKTSVRSHDNFVPTHSVHDPQLRLLYFNGASWSVQSRTVCFLIKYTDGETLGLPYDMTDINAKVFGGTMQCQVICPEEDVAVNTLGFWVRKLGNPSTLNITLEQPRGTVHRFVVIDPGDVSIIYSWGQGPIQPFVLQEGETYYLCARSPGSDAYNYYELRHPSVAVDCDVDILNSTWGDTKSRENNNEYHDLTFRMNITTMPLPPSDDDGGVGPDTITETAINSPSMIEDTLAEMKTLSGLYEEKIDDKISKALAHIEKSLDPDLWFDDDHLDEKHGHKVFNEDKKAVKELMRLLDKKETPDEIVEIIQRTILEIVEADKKLANTVYTEVQRDTGDKNVDHEWEKASQELLKAEEELSRVDKEGIPDPRYDKAIDHYKKAWEHSQSAIEHAS